MTSRTPQLIAAAALFVCTFPMPRAHAADAVPTATVGPAANQNTPPAPPAQNAAPASPDNQAPRPEDMPPPPPPPMPVAAPAPPKHGPAPAGVAAIVNGEKILVSGVKDLSYRWEGPNITEKILIPNLLIAQEGKKRGVTVTRSEVDARINETRQQILASNPTLTLESALAQGHRSMADFRDNVRLRIMAEKLVLKGLPPTRFVHVRHILIMTTAPNNGAPQTKPLHTDEEAQALIAKVQSELRAGSTFESLAQKYSEDPSNKDKGGDLGVVGPTSPFDPAFLAAALKLKKGEVTAVPVKSYFGYHLIMADSTDLDHSPEEAKAYNSTITAFRGIEKFFNQQRATQGVGPLVEELRRKSKVVDYLLP